MSTAAAAIKAALLALTDEDGRKKLGWVLAAILSPVIVVVALVCVFSAASQHNISTVELCFHGGTIPDSAAPEYRQAVSPRRLALFLNSSLAGRMARADGAGVLHKEQPFVLGLPASELGAEFPEEETVLIQGIIDVYFEEDDETETYKIVTTVRGNSLKGLISSESPLGKALLGHKLGDRVHVQVNETSGYDVIIKRIEKTVDDGSDALRSF